MQTRKKRSIIERYNRVRSNRIKVIFEINKNHRWIEILENIVKRFNNSKHRTIGMKPILVNKNNEKKLLEKVFKYIPPDFANKSKFKVSDRVRTADRKILFN